MSWADSRTQVITLFADCVPVEGSMRSAIYDLSRHEVHLFPTSFYRLLEWLTSRTIGDILDQLESFAEAGDAGVGVEAVNDFIRFLLDNELAQPVDDPTRFPRIPLTWDFPGQIHNAVIDVDEVHHDFEAIIAQLDLLGCQFLQLRGFSQLLDLRLCREVMSCSRNTTIECVELIIKYDPSSPVENYAKFLSEEPLLTALTVHSVPEDVRASAQQSFAPFDEVRGDILLTSQVIDSDRHCGVITPRYLSAPSVATYTEFRLFNGCLNRKIAIDATGQIRNCPSMAKSFGHVRDRSLQAVLHNPEFVSVWAIRKDTIDVCRQCEFRYMCSDCRAFLEDPANQHSKPLKCGYDPNTGIWQSWYRPMFKWPVIKTYGTPVPSAALPASSDHDTL